MSKDGRFLALSALAGAPTPRIPAGFLTWGFEYYWKVAGLEPWRLCRGSNTDWQQAHRGLYDRHSPDIMFYSGAGSGEASPLLIEETREHWLVEDGNTGTRIRLLKSSLTEIDTESGTKPNDPLGVIESKEDADALIGPFTGWGKSYLDGLTSLIDYCGDDALVLPHHSPGYICACYAFGFVEAMAMMIDDPDLFCYVADLFAAGDDLRMKELADAGAQAVYIADGWASVDIISPSMFRTFALPYQQSMIAAARKHGLRAVLWNEGDVVPILRDETTLPWDAFGMEQSRKGIDLDISHLRSAVGPTRCIFGNFDSEYLLIHGTKDEVVAAVHEQLSKANAGGIGGSGGNPFVFCTGSPVPSDASPEAVDWMLAAVASN